MSGFYRISALKRRLLSIQNIGEANRFNKALGKKLDTFCSKCNVQQGTSDSLLKIKEVNQVLSKALSNASRSNSKDFRVNENIKGSYKTTFEQTRQALYAVYDAIEEKREQYKQKFLKSKSTEKLFGNIVKRGVPVFGLSATGLSIVPDSPASKAATTADPPVEVIPEPPAIPDISVEALNQLNELGEPTFASLGLGGWTPVGMVQNCLEYAHVSLGLEWWTTIVLGTLIVRTLLFPLVVIAQRNSAKMNNTLPQMQALQMKMADARQTGDAINAARYGQELMAYMQKEGVNPIKNMIVPLAQAPIFISIFMGLRQMTNVPVESLRTGGLYWFTDLTLPDQYFLLPCITSLTLWLTLELGADAAKLSTQHAGIMKLALRLMPIVILPFTINFPGAILCYWVSTNLFSLCQVAFLRIPTVRKFCKIPETIPYKPEDLPLKPKGFQEGLKDSWTNLKITKELEERRKLDERLFRKAGKGPVQKTFKYDPTKQTSPVGQASISAKKRD